MGRIDPKKLKSFQKQLEEKSSGNRDWIYSNKIEDAIDVRILEPLANLNGRYFLEVPVWWVAGKRFISPEIFGEPDVIGEVIEEAKNENNTELDALIAATDSKGKKLAKRFEYWLPILVFDWKLEDNNIVGIYTKDDEVDLALLDNFIRDKHYKIIVCGPMLMKAINKLATVRGGIGMFDKVKGTNILLTKTGTGRNTVYAATKMDDLPMPDKYYETDNTPDLIKMCQAGIRTEGYLEQIIENYLFGDPAPEDGDDTYRYPEARVRDDDKPVEEPSPIEKGVEAPPVEEVPPVEKGVEAPAEDKAEEAPAEEKAAEAPSTRSRRGRSVTKDAPAPKAAVKTTRPGRRNRNVMEDVN